MPKLSNRATNITIAACAVVALLCPVIWYKAATHSAEPPVVVLRSGTSMGFADYPAAGYGTRILSLPARPFCQYIPLTNEWRIERVLEQILRDLNICQPVAAFTP